MKNVLVLFSIGVVILSILVWVYMSLTKQEKEVIL